jgi:hypothetical protein
MTVAEGNHGATIRPYFEDETSCPLCLLALLLIFPRLQRGTVGSLGRDCGRQNSSPSSTQATSRHVSRTPGNFIWHCLSARSRYVADRGLMVARRAGSTVTHLCISGPVCGGWCLSGRRLMRQPSGA